MSFRHRRDQHDKIAVPMVMEKFKSFGFDCFVMGTETDDKGLQLALKAQHDDTSLMVRYRPDRILIKRGERSFLCEIKSEEGRYENFAVEVDSYIAATLWNAISKNVMHAFVNLKFVFRIRSGLQIESDLSNGIIAQELRQQFVACGLPLSGSATLTVKEKDSKWQIDNQNTMYLVFKQKIGHGNLGMLNIYDLSNSSITCCWLNDIPKPPAVKIPCRGDHQKALHRIKERLPYTTCEMIEWRNGSGTPYFLIPKLSPFLIDFNTFMITELVHNEHGVQNRKANK